MMVVHAFRHSAQAQSVHISHSIVVAASHGVCSAQVLCLCNLAGSAPSSSDLLRKLVKAGALAPMLALTTSNNEHARRIALVSLRKIALVPGHEQVR